MSLLLNIIWFVFGGFLVSLAYNLGGILLCNTIIGIPFGIQCFKLSILGMAPYGHEIRETEPPGVRKPLSLVPSGHAYPNPIELAINS